MAAAAEKFSEIFSMSQDPSIYEVGGGHGQKGVDFQRFWAIVRIFELKSDGAADFLLLFESVQDVAELDSETSPNRIDIYQIKKKDGGEWSFNALTGLPKPDGRKKKLAPIIASVQSSPLGKLYKAGLAFQYLDSNVHFISNAGCDLPLAGSGMASGHMKCVASDLDTAHTQALAEGLALLHATPGSSPDLTRLALRKTTLHPDEPLFMALGAAVDYLSKNLPAHAGQAKALVEALFMQFSTLGRQTASVGSFDELRQQRGFSMAELNSALAALKDVPDLKEHFDSVLASLSLEGLPTLRKLGINVGASKYFSNLVSGATTDQERALIGDCVQLAPLVSAAIPLLPAMESEVQRLVTLHPGFKETEIFAYLLIQVTKHATT